MSEVTLREYKDWPLAGGTLLVSVPHFGTGGTLLTDHVLDLYQMDHYAAIDSDQFPPLAMVRKGKARYPLRVHADPASRLVVLRSELNPAPHLARPLAETILAWTRQKGIAQIVALDSVGAEPTGHADGSQPQLYAVASTERARKRIHDAGVQELDDAVLGGLLAMLVLEARFEDVDVIGLVAELRSAFDEAQSLLAFGEALPRLVPKLRVDIARLRAESKQITETIRGIQTEIERTMRKMERRPETDGPSIYG